MNNTQDVTQEIRTINDWIEEAQSQGGTLDLYSGKRREVRRLWDAMLDLHILTGASASKMIYATARDVSVGGIGIMCRHKLGSGTLLGVYVSGCDQGATAIVRHCTETVGGYVIGLEFMARLSDPAVASNAESSRRTHRRYNSPARLVG